MRVSDAVTDRFGVPSRRHYDTSYRFLQTSAPDLSGMDGNEPVGKLSIALMSCSNRTHEGGHLMAFGQSRRNDIPPPSFVRRHDRTSYLALISIAKRDHHPRYYTYRSDRAFPDQVMEIHLVKRNDKEDSSTYTMKRARRTLPSGAAI